MILPPLDSPLSRWPSGEHDCDDQCVAVQLWQWWWWWWWWLWWLLRWWCENAPFVVFSHFFYIFYPGGQAGSEVGLDQQQIRNDWKNIFNVQKYPKLIRNISTIKSSEAKCWAPRSRLWVRCVPEEVVLNIVNWKWLKSCRIVGGRVPVVPSKVPTLQTETQNPKRQSWNLLFPTGALLGRITLHGFTFGVWVLSCLGC